MKRKRQIIPERDDALFVVPPRSADAAKTNRQPRAGCRDAAACAATMLPETSGFRIGHLESRHRCPRCEEGKGQLFGPEHLVLRTDPLRGVRPPAALTFDPRPPISTSMPAAPPPPDEDAPTCDGIGHAWRILPADGHEQHAVARCCGIRAVSRFGGPWTRVDEDDPHASAD